VHSCRHSFFIEEETMQRPRSNDAQPGTETRDPAEGKRTDHSDEPNADIAAQPGTKAAPPAEGGDNVSGAEQPPGRRQ
jgi:hypothetical protein